MALAVPAQRHDPAFDVLACGVVILNRQPLVAIECATDLFKDLVVHLGREQRLASANNSNLLEPLAFLPGCRLFAELALRLRKEARHGFHQARRQQMPKLLFGQSQQ